jgi:hypothetical protein
MLNNTDNDASNHDRSSFRNTRSDGFNQSAIDVEDQEIADGVSNKRGAKSNRSHGTSYKI